MIKLEKDIQSKFFDSLINQEEGHENSSISVYQKLVYLRYEDVIKNAFPLFIENISEKELENSILCFMRNTPKSPFVWKIPNLYRKFVKKNSFFDNKKYLYELLYFDWIEIKLCMKEYKDKKSKPFSYKKSYTLSNSVKIKGFEFDIINKEFDKERENYLIVYYDFDIDEVVYREVNPVIYFLLKSLGKNLSINKYLKKLCNENEIDFKEAKKLLKPILEELTSKNCFNCIE